MVNTESFLSKSLFSRLTLWYELLLLVPYAYISVTETKLKDSPQPKAYFNNFNKE